MKVHFTIEFPTRSGEPAEYADDVDVMNPQVSMRPEGHPSSFPVSNKGAQALSSEAQAEMKELERKLREGEMDKGEMEVALKRYQKRNLDLIEKLQEANMERARLKAMMRKAPDEQIQELIDENSKLKAKLKTGVDDALAEGAQDAGELKSEIKELRQKLKRAEERAASRGDKERELQDDLDKTRLSLEKAELDLREERAKLDEKYRHFEELNQYISDLLNEKKLLGLEVDNKSKEILNLKEEIQDMDKARANQKTQIKTEVEEASLEENKKRWQEFRDRIEQKDREIETLKSDLREAEKSLQRAGGSEEPQVRRIGIKGLEAIDTSEDICDNLNLEINKTDTDDLRTLVSECKYDKLLPLVSKNAELLRDRLELIYNYLHG